MEDYKVDCYRCCISARSRHDCSAIGGKIGEDFNTAWHNPVPDMLDGRFKRRCSVCSPCISYPDCCFQKFQANGSSTWDEGMSCRHSFPILAAFAAPMLYTDLVPSPWSPSEIQIGRAWQRWLANPMSKPKPHVAKSAKSVLTPIAAQVQFTCGDKRVQDVRGQ